MRNPFTFRLVGVCPAGHVAEIFSALIDPADTSTLAAAEAAIPGGGVLGKCQVCGQPHAVVRTQIDGLDVEETPVAEFNARAAGKAPPRNYG